MQLMGGLLNVSICLVLTLGAGVEAWYLLLLLLLYSLTSCSE